MRSHPRILKRRARLLSYLFAALVLTAVASGFTHIITQRDPLAATDFSVFWASARLVRQGQSPYDSDSWAAIYRQIPDVIRQDPSFLYPLPTAFLFVPLSFLRESLARDLWLVSSQLMLVGAAVIVMAAENWRRDRMPMLLTFCLSLIVFLPAMYSIMNGQINSLLLVLIASTFLLWSRSRWLAGGCVLGLLCLKPTGAGTLLLGVVIWLILRRQWRGLLGAALTVAAAFTLAWLVDPRWLADWLQRALAKPASMWHEVPTVWGLFVSLFGPKSPWLILAAMLSVILMLLGVRLALRTEPYAQRAWLSGVLIPLSLIATPYLLMYEMVMLIPSILTAMALLDRAGAPFGFVISYPLLISVLSVCNHALSLKIGDTVWILFPLLVMGSFLLIWGYASRRDLASPGTVEA